MPASTTVKPGDLLRSQGSPLELAREFLQTATENALVSATPVVNAFEGQSVLKYPAIQEELFEGLAKLIEGEDLPVLSAGPITKLAKVIERNLEIGTPKGESVTELAPDLRLILRYLISPNASEPGFAFSDVLIKLNDTDDREIFDLLLNSKPLLEAHKEIQRVIKHWEDKKPISRDMHQGLLGKFKELNSHLDKLAEDLEFNGALYLFFNNGEVKSSEMKLGSFSGRNLESFAVKYLGSPLPGAPSTGDYEPDVSDLALTLRQLKKELVTGIRYYKKNLEEDFEETYYGVLPRNLAYIAVSINNTIDYRTLIEERLKKRRGLELETLPLAGSS